MYSKVITYTGNGTFQSFTLEFDALAVWIIPSNAAHVGYHMPTMWCARSNALGARETVTSGARLQNRVLKVATDASVNASGVSYTAIVVGAEDGDIEAPSWIGNATAGRVISLMRAATPIASIVKRDNPLPPIITTSSVTSRALDGTAIATDAVAHGSGTLILASANAVNQYDGNQSGEGIDGFAVHSDSGATVGTYSGTGAAQDIAVGANAAMVIVWRTDTAEVGGVFVSGATSSKTCDASAPTAGAGSLGASGLSLTGATFNASGATYGYLAIPTNTPGAALPAAPAILLGGKKALRFAGAPTAEYVDFGTGLNIDTEITLEWIGWTPGEPGQSDNYDAWLLGKAASSQTSVAGSASWGMSVVNRINENALNWQGPHLCAVVSGRVYYPSPISASCWRTGVVHPGGMHMLTYTRRADGSSEFWRDGVRIKQRIIGTDVLTSNTAHRVTMGARHTGSAYAQPARMAIQSARVYNRGLTNAEIIARAERALYASSTADVTSGLVAHWDAADIVGTTWNDRVGTNHGTITGGTVVDL